MGIKSGHSVVGTLLTVSQGSNQGAVQAPFLLGAQGPHSDSQDFGRTQFLAQVDEVPISLLAVGRGRSQLLEATHIPCHTAPSFFKDISEVSLSCFKPLLPRRVPSLLRTHLMESGPLGIISFS